MLVDGDGYQTVTLVPSDTGTGEVSYVLVVQEETKPVVKLDIKVKIKGRSLLLCSLQILKKHMNLGEIDSVYGFVYQHWQAKT